MKRLLVSIACLAMAGSLAACSGKKEEPRQAAPAAGGQPMQGMSAAKATKGAPAPDFTLQDLDGKSHRLSEYKGKVVILNFWATWCPPCREEIPSMMKLNKMMAGKPFVMLCASIDEGGKEAVEGYYKSSGNRLPTLLDTTRSVAELYGTTGVPETFVIGRDGIILEKAVGAVNWMDPQVVDYLNGAMGLKGK